MNFYPMMFEFDYKNFHNGPIQLNLTNFAMNYTTINHEPVLLLQLPLVTDWSFSLNYECKLGFLGMIHFKGHISFNITEAIGKAVIKLDKTDDGLLNPILKDLNVDFGSSTLYTNGWFKQFFFRQIFNFLKYVLMDSINRFGSTLYGMVLPNLVRYYTNDQFKTFSINMPSIGKKGDFNIDYRLTSNPEIDDGILDLDFFFDIGAGLQKCNLRQEDLENDFENFDSNYLQLILSDRLVNCLLDSME